MSEALRRAVGQLLMVGFEGYEVNAHIEQMIRRYHIGGVILFRRNIDTPAQVAAMCRRLQEINAEVSDQPLLIGIDQEGGMVMRIEEGVTPLPSAMAYQAVGSVDDCVALSRIGADELRQMGINLNLAPDLDINNNPLNPVIGVRAFGEDVATVNRYGLAAMRGMQDAGIGVMAKHFPGHGDTAADSHYALPVVPHDKARLDAVELAPFKAAIAAGVDSMMTAHVVFPAIEPDTSVPATLSRAVLTGLLRDELGFDGLVLTDCLEMAPIAEGIGIAEGAVLSVLAGADMVLVSHLPHRQTAAAEALYAAARQGRLDADQIVTATRRIHALKQKPAMQDWRSLPLPPAGLRTPDALALAARVQADAVQLVGAFRPLDTGKSVLLITLEVHTHTEIDEVALGKNKEERGSLLPGLLDAGLSVSEAVLEPNARNEDVARIAALAKQAEQIVLQSYNAVLFSSQQALLAALPVDRTWLVAGRLPYDLDLAPRVQGRLAAFGNRPAALAPVLEHLLGKREG
ncbi:beta-N-acetylhexosaminidase [Andreprevotia lacus DSM 23236]|jgi:beta-N-acetylhexosaminidase|uniref:Beta-N-acetylhexosaminidase n=1 Tax=Andreprevotia lacus DSM 23236 TaxID=1121001 RepID=A0A1W1XJN7_9NEIS|nr:beta-N-acetylhexosaminidase [Andreprevotia lacus]SMC23741.1 beta-N-acetylhexosaminidase [Andreprevotia lacus DSM 23236]